MNNLDTKEGQIAALADYDRGNIDWSECRKCREVFPGTFNTPERMYTEGWRVCADGGVLCGNCWSVKETSEFLLALDPHAFVEVSVGNPEMTTTLDFNHVQKLARAFLASEKLAEAVNAFTEASGREDIIAMGATYQHLQAALAEYEKVEGE